MVMRSDCLCCLISKVFATEPLEIRCDINNIRSKKIPERLGFELEATLKKNRLNPQTKIPSDTLVYARFNADNLPNLSVTWGAST